MSWFEVGRPQPLTLVGSKGKVLVEDVSFALPRGAFLAVMGPSGAGKSTLLDALTGMRFAARGDVRLAGEDLYARSHELGKRIAYVPREEILHRELTVRQALGFAARLRPTPRHGRSLSVETMIERLGLADCADREVQRISEGEFKRARIAAELLAEPEVIVLDEPTSNLDPRSEDIVVHVLQELQGRGTTVIAATHSTRLLAKLRPNEDYLLFLRQPERDAPARIAFFGTVGQAFAACAAPVTVEGADAVLTRLHEGTLRSRHPVSDDGTEQGLTPAPATPAAWRQFGTLLMRHLTVGTRRSVLGPLVGAPVILGALLFFVLPGNSFHHDLFKTHPDARTVALFLVFAVSLLAAFTATDELIRERSIFRRERSSGLSTGAYLLSKALYLTIVVLLQTVVVVLIAVPGRQGGPDDAAWMPGAPNGALIELLIDLGIAGLGAMTLGLVVSAWAGSQLAARSWLSIVVVAQLALSGVLVALNNDVSVIGSPKYVNTVYWGFAAVASSIDLYGLYSPTKLDDANWIHAERIWATDLGYLIAIAVTQLALAWLILVAGGAPRRPRVGRIRPAATVAWRIVSGVPRTAGGGLVLAAGTIVALVLVFGGGPSMLTSGFDDTAHAKAVTGLDFSPSGSRLVSSSEDGTIKLWNGRSRFTDTELVLERPRIDGPPCLAGTPIDDAAVTAITFLADDEHLAAGYQDGAVLLWNLANGVTVSCLPAQGTAKIRQLAWSPVSGLLARLTDDGIVVIWDAEQQIDQVLLRSAASDTITAMAFSADGGSLLLGTAGGVVKRVHLDDNAEAIQLRHLREITTVAEAPDGRYVVAGTEDGLVLVWDTQVSSTPTILTAGTQAVRVAVFAPAHDPGCPGLATGGDNARVLLWPLPPAADAFKPAGAGAGVRAIAFSPDGTLMLVGSSEGRLSRPWECRAVTPGIEASLDEGGD